MSRANTYQQQHSGGSEEPQHVPVYDVLEGEGVIGPASVVYLLERYQAVFSADTGHIESVALFQYSQNLPADGAKVSSFAYLVEGYRRAVAVAGQIRNVSFQEVKTVNHVALRQHRPFHILEYAGDQQTGFFSAGCDVHAVAYGIALGEPGVGKAP